MIDDNDDEEPGFFRKAAQTFAGIFAGGVGGLVGPYGALQIPPTYAPARVYGSTGARTYGGYPELGEKNRALIGTQRYRTYDNTVVSCDIAGAGVRLFLDLFAGAEWSTKPAEPPKGMKGEAPAKAFPPGGAAGAGAPGATRAAAVTAAIAAAAASGKKPAADKEPKVDPKAQRYADLVGELVLKPSQTLWETAMKYLGGYRYYDNRVAEVIYERRASGYWGVADISPRPNHTITHWAVDEHGAIDGVVQLVPQTQEYVPLPRGKLVIIADNTISSMPEGLGLLRHVIEPANRLARYRELESIGFETTLEGMPIGYAPYQKLQELEAKGTIPGFKAAAYTADLEKMVQNKIVTRQRGLTLDSQPFTAPDGTPSNVPQFKLDVVRSDGRGQADLHVSIERDTRHIAIILYVEHLVLGGGKGAYNLAKDKTDRLVALINSTLKEVAAALKRDIVLPIMRLNGWPEELAPDLIPSDVSQLDVEAATTALQRMALAGEQIGAPTEDEAPDVIRKRIGLPKRPPFRPELLLPQAPPKSPNDPITQPTDPNAGAGKPAKPKAD